jgi:hypothetical protein
MRVKTWVLAVVAVAIFFGGIVLASALGFWKTTNEKVPASISSGEYAGQADPLDIRGSYTFSDISKNFGVPLDRLGTAFGVENPAQFKCKDLESLYGDAEGVEIGTESVRYFVALYLGMEVDDTDAAELPRAAADVLTTDVPLTGAQTEQLAAHTVDP